MLDTGIDVTPCAKRCYLWTDYSDKFENCSRGGEGKWRVTGGGRLGSAEFKLGLSEDGKTAEAEFDFTSRTPPPHVWTTQRHYKVQLHTKVVGTNNTERWIKVTRVKGTVTSPAPYPQTTTDRSFTGESDLPLTPQGADTKPCRE